MQIHGLQIRQMTKANVVAIINVLGRVESVKESVKGVAEGIACVCKLISTLTNLCARDV